MNKYLKLQAATDRTIDIINMSNVERFSSLGGKTSITFVSGKTVMYEQTLSEIEDALALLK